MPRRSGRSFVSWSLPATNAVSARACSRSRSRPRSRGPCGSSIREHGGAAVGYKRAMSKVRRFALDEITIRPGTYFNPQTEVLIVVYDSPEVDHEIFERDEFEGSDWVLISEDSPLDENKRDDLVERFQLAHTPGDELALGEDEVDLDADRLDVEDEEHELGEEHEHED